MPDHLSTLVNSCLLPAYGGATPADWLKREIDDGLAGIVLYGANLGLLDGRLRELVTGPLRAHRSDLVIALDEEGGDITRAEYHRGSNYPGALALGVVDDVELTGRVGAAVAADLIEAGISVNLAPCLEICPGTDLPVFGTRSFGADPARVAAHARAFVEGVQRHGVAATAKHFPGLGSTRVDSHFELPVVPTPEDRFRARDLVPFAAAVAAGVQAVMTGHVAVPAIDEAPATFSRRFVTDILRGELAFDGVVISDSLDMRSARGTLGFGGAAVRAWAAGVDLMIIGPQDGEQICAEIRESARRAVADGVLSLARLEEAADRVARLRELTGSPVPPDDDLAEVGLTAARRALAVRGAAPRPGERFVVELRPEPGISCGTVPWGLVDALERLGAPAGSVLVEPGTAAGSLAVPDGVPLAVVARTEYADPWQEAVVAALLADRPDAVLVDMGYRDLPVPAGTTVLKTYGAGLVNAVAAAELLLGRRWAGAPRDLPGLA
ncbi:glycoside hydrolase family 3 N-terminal domain-containing protein [Kitasatospora sp. NPDC101801]|uniref:glycoside hydrolase family 3 N-terminal domain-containing protein n=1 Tax=Kitasatospora sp. NPDC101801 TaxID=3364103 RepID=UPI00380819A2